MIFNYLKVGFRSLIKNRFYTIINVLGLTVGLTCSALISLYVIDELGYDKFHRDYDRIYRVGVSGSLGGQVFNAAVNAAPMAAKMAEDFPEVESAVRLSDWDNVAITYEDNRFVEEHFLLADSNFFQFFDFELIEGEPASVLEGNNKIVLTEDAAVKYFNWSGPGDTSPLGKLVGWGTGNATAEVTGIAANPSQSHIDFDVVLSMSSFEQSKSQIWLSNNFFTYFKLIEGGDIAATHKNLESLIETNIAPQIEQFIGKTMEEFRESGDFYRYYTQPLSEIYFNSDSEAELSAGGNLQYVYILSAIALFIVLLACINFMNMSTARSANRAREVGIRKTVGGTRSGLSLQFLIESVLISVLSALPSLIFIYLLLEPFNTLSGKSISFEIFFQPGIYLSVLGLALFVGILAGTYPALYLTSFRPAQVLKGRISAGMKSSGIRSALVIFQFWISIVLVICTLIVFQQLDAMQNKNLGFDKENILVIDNARKLGNSKLSFRDELMKYDDIVAASISQSVPPGIQNNSVVRPEGSEQDQLMFFYNADEYHLQTLGYEIVQGRYFREDNPADSMSIVINEAALRHISWDNIEGRRFKTFWRSEQGDMMNVVGVVKDFNFETLKNQVRPLLFQYSTGGNILCVRLSKGDVATKVDFIKSQWDEATGGAPFEYSFLDDNFDALFKAEQQLGRLSMVFTGLAIFVACLGLFALATFTAEQRSKEIGVRKVMGASNLRIVTILSGQFTKLVLISFVLAVPAGYLAMREWLESFAYQTEIGILTFVIAGGGALLLALVTVGFQSYRAASVNPVRSLRSE